MSSQLNREDLQDLDNAANFRMLRGLSMCAILLLLIFAIIEIKENVSGTDSHGVIIVETAVLAAGIVFLWAQWKTFALSFGRLRTVNRQLSAQVTESEQEAAEWKIKAHGILKNLDTMIDTEFTRWNLTPAEKEVALGLLKGLSHKEIAASRNSSEKTVRLQAASLYQKANLDGRAQLSAFFLAGLFLPSQVSQIPKQE